MSSLMDTNCVNALRVVGAELITKAKSGHPGIVLGAAPTVYTLFTKIMNIDPDDLMSPGPILYYPYQGSEHPYIPDFYYQPYNLLIEVKDGGNNPNKKSMPDTLRITVSAYLRRT